MENRIGIGYDIHRLVKGRRLVLGGVEIPHPKGLKGHSDADALLHAISDALLGALALGDIGEHFPNTDKRYKNISSLKLLNQVLKLVKHKGFKIRNIDTVVIADKPTLNPFKPRMRRTIAKTLNIKLDDINIKATTQEGLRFSKGCEAIAAYAIALLEK